MWEHICSVLSEHHYLTVTVGIIQSYACNDFSVAER